MPRPRVIPAGARSGRLVVTHKRNPGEDRVQCRCDCGTEKSISATRWGRSQSCGCLQIEATKKANTVHGMANSTEYTTWDSMWTRCTNPASRYYADYGGRGITVCDRWRDFANFYTDMGPRPDGKTLDRIDNDRGYSPDNCRWASRREQANNQRPKRLAQQCGKGHAYTPENTYVRPDGGRACRTCRRSAWALWSSRQPDPEATVDHAWPLALPEPAVQGELPS